MDPIVLLATRDIPALQIHAGDLVTVRPGHDRPVVVQFEIEPNYGALLLATEEGALESLDGATLPRVADRLREAVGGPLPPPRPWRRRRGRGLRIV